jgi:hypothetical protein
MREFGRFSGQILAESAVFAALAAKMRPYLKNKTWTAEEMGTGRLRLLQFPFWIV